MSNENELIYVGSRKIVSIGDGFGIRFPKIIADNIPFSKEDSVDMFFDKKNKVVVIKFEGEKDE